MRNVISRPAARFRQMDLTRALKAAKDSGLPLKRLEINSAGTIVLSFTDAELALPLAVSEPNPWDEAI